MIQYDTRGKHVKSTNPLKAKIVDALKDKTGANKVTLVRDLGNGVFSGHCMKRQGRNGPSESLGFHEVTLHVEE